uniref:Uncharacterized protein n=1 Tax=Arundo donax TaxID=35708 RepID=A0A0A9G677_ARUDO
MRVTILKQYNLPRLLLLK